MFRFVPECGPQNEIPLEKGPAAVHRAEWWGDRRQLCDHQRVEPAVHKGPGHHTGQQPEELVACFDLYGREPLVLVSTRRYTDLQQVETIRLYNVVVFSYTVQTVITFSLNITVAVNTLRLDFSIVVFTNIHCSPLKIIIRPSDVICVPNTVDIYWHIYIEW